MLVQGRAATSRALMVMTEGRARVVGGSEAQEVNRRLRAKYLRPEVLGDRECLGRAGRCRHRDHP